MRPPALAETIDHLSNSAVDYPGEDRPTGSDRSPGRGRLADLWRVLDDHERLLWSVVVVVLFADLVTTTVGLQAGLAEGNPAMRLALATGGIAALAAVKLAALGVGWAVRWVRPRFGPVVALGLAGPWLLASVSNAAMML